MKVAMFYGGKDIRIETLPDPVPGPGEVLVDIQAAGICGSDLHGYRSGPRPGRTYPTTAGHELAGAIAALGPGVTGLTVGQRVGIEPLHLIGCGQCRWCREGHTEACPRRGQNPDGSRRHSHGFAELDVVPAANCYPLPEGVSVEAAGILDVYGCAVHAVHRVPVHPGDNVVVVGSGAIGLSAAEAYRALGAHQVIVVGNHDAVLDKAKTLVADRVVNAAKVDVVQAVQELTDGEGADIVIEAVGGRASTFASDCHMLARNGTLGILGSYQNPQTLDSREAMAKQIQIAWINSYGRWEGVSEYQIALDMIVADRFHPLKLITHRVSLDDIVSGFEVAVNKEQSGAIKVLVMP